MQITTRDSPSTDWDDYVRTAPGGSLYHASAWVRIPREVFGQRIFFLEARASGGQLVGVLPVVQQRGPVFGSYLTSLPYFNYGSVVADTEETALQLMESARTLAAGLKCRYLELRDTVRHECAWPVRTDKVSMLLDLPADGDALGKQLGAKLRSQIRRPDREGVEVCVDVPGSLDAFYEVFCRNMHALGTPVYPRRFFQALRDTFPEHCSLVVLQQGGVPQAAGFLLIHGNIAEIPWAACREDAKRRGYNMKLYWECLLHAMARGCRQFDFGRSTAGSGTYQFKAQWGALPKQLFWYRWESRVPDPAARSDGEGRLKEIVARTWSRLPLGMANLIGPLVSPRLPW